MSYIFSSPLLNNKPLSFKLQNIAKQVCTLLRAIAGNDDVKTSIVDAGGLALIVAAMTTHAKQPMVAEQGCAALGSIALRSPSNCTAIVGAGGVEAILKAMEIHPDAAGVQVGRDFARSKSIHLLIIYRELDLFLELHHVHLFILIASIHFFVNVH